MRLEPNEFWTVSISIWLRTSFTRLDTFFVSGFLPFYFSLFLYLHPGENLYLLNSVAFINNEYVHLDFEHQGTKQHLFGNLSYVESALWKVQQFKRAINMPDEETDLAGFTGSMLEVYVRQREYEGKKQNEVTEYREYGGKDTDKDKEVFELLNDTPQSDDDDIDSSDLPF